MDWDKLRVFHAVAEAGSFTHAGEVLNLSQSAVSRQISALEESLHAPLFHRHARGLILTEQGELLYQTVHEVFAKLAMVEARLVEAKDRPQGPLKITTTLAFGSLWLTPKLKDFMREYPEIAISVILDDHELDLSMREADVAIRFMPPTQQDLVQRTICTMHYQVFATPEYLRQHGVPQTPQDLDNHALIAYGEEARPPVENLNWLLTVGTEEGRPRAPVLTMNNIYGIYRAVQSGLGVAALPDYFSHESSNLVRVLPELEGPNFEVYFVYPEELRNAKRISVFRDFLMRKLTETLS